MTEPRLPRPMRASRPLQDEDLLPFIFATLDQLAGLRPQISNTLSPEHLSRSVVEVDLPADTGDTMRATIIDPSPRRLTLRQIARSIVLDLRAQDRANADVRPPLEQIQGWRTSAAQAGDHAVVHAIDYLGERGAADVYERGGQNFRFSDDDLRRLQIWWTRRNT